MNKNLCIRRAIKRNRFGAERGAEWGRIHQPGDPDKAGDRLGPTVLPAQSPCSRSRAHLPPRSKEGRKERSSRARIRRRFERDRRIVAAKFIPLTHTHGQTRAQKGFTILPPSLPPFSPSEIGFTILRCPWKPGTSGLCARCTSVLYPTGVSHPSMPSSCGSFFFLSPSFFLFFFFFKKIAAPTEIRGIIKGVGEKERYRSMSYKCF